MDERNYINGVVKVDTILVLDFGGQYNQLIARRVRECGVYSVVRSWKTTVEEIRAEGYKGVILTGGPSSVYEAGSPKADPRLFDLRIPVLGICYGAQMMAHQLGGKTLPASNGEYGHSELRLCGRSVLLDGLMTESDCFTSHKDSIESVPAGFKITAKTDFCKVAAMEDASKGLFAVQFHPEVEHTEIGRGLFKNFTEKICKCEKSWTMSSFITKTIEEVRLQAGDWPVLCALSGGVDSSVAAVLTHKAIGDKLTCIFVDHGLMRKGEGDQVERIFRDKFSINLIRVNCRDRFLERLKGVADPEEKRKIIGEEFVRVFEEEAKKLGKIGFLAQGTIYPDIIESGIGDAAVIKSHHNVGGMPSNIDFKGVIEPLRLLFKDEVRQCGLQLGIEEALVRRQPFPGPGLGVRVLGEITAEKLDILRETDAIYREEIDSAGLSGSINQYFAVLTGLRSVGVMGDGRTYDYTVALRGVTTTDFMTAEWARIPYDVLQRVSSRIVGEVRGVNRVVYDITSKPPATIEWE